MQVNISCMKFRNREYFTVFAGFPPSGKKYLQQLEPPSFGNFLRASAKSRPGTFSNNEHVSVELFS